DELVNKANREDILKKNEILKDVLDEMLDAGVKGLYHLNKEELNLSMDATVDGIHPNDLGMHEYARSYEHKLRGILREPKGEVITQKPVIQWRDYQVYDWKKRHDYLLDGKMKQQGKVNVVIGNSIIHFFGGNDSEINRGGKSWNKYMDKNALLNYSYGWDRIENVLWRIYHDELEGLDIDHLFLFIGTNNLGINTNEEILQGISFLVEAIQRRRPEVKIVLIGILPRRNTEDRINQINQGIKDISNNLSVDFVDFGNQFLNESGKIEEKYFSDGLHPSESGYKILGKSFDLYLNSVNK
ncbi:MAG: GDSL-type esterase/lipase family protein, partial [Cyclobacteriaceae bacterium]|nr:GDSL-type esterase/lipase family protein [Cyclobacteriaceae bacterium]